MRNCLPFHFHEGFHLYSKNFRNIAWLSHPPSVWYTSSPIRCQHLLEKKYGCICTYGIKGFHNYTSIIPFICRLLLYSASRCKNVVHTGEVSLWNTDTFQFHFQEHDYAIAYWKHFDSVMFLVKERSMFYDSATFITHSSNPWSMSRLYPSVVSSPAILQLFSNCNLHL